ncbi:Methylene tetrahydromethanopterin dehydrogenase [hydrothermal vent metagenome]|uniref:Methylene tetrahydromethanopterin dehydrogenase n=1 Tax=hydrothermal vent metagenome TaxID=652676 RepID=A0A3B1DE57_9ZZZZ
MKKILIQFDTDTNPSSFDRVVAVDSGVDELFSYGGIHKENVEALVHGAIFTRGVKDLHSTAIFIGGSDVSAGELLFDAVNKTFFGPMRVSVMMDSNGCNTTAVAAVLCAKKHLDLSTTKALVLGGTGPVGQRSAELLARAGAEVRVASRSLSRAEDVCNRIAALTETSLLTPCTLNNEAEVNQVTEGVTLIIAAGAAGVQLLSAEQLSNIETLQVAIDLNAVPPAGLEGVSLTDKNENRSGVFCYGPIGVGNLKIKIHKEAINQLFSKNDLLLDTTTIYNLGSEIDSI